MPTTGPGPMSGAGGREPATTDMSTTPNPHRDHRGHGTMSSAGAGPKSFEPHRGGIARPRVVVSEPRGADELPIASLLDPDVYDVVWCNEDEDVLEQVIQQRPQAVVFALGFEFQKDLALLFLLRRVAPTVPLILVAATASLEAQKTIQELRPTFYVVRPVDRGELLQALADTVARQARRLPPG